MAKPPKTGLPENEWRAKARQLLQANLVNLGRKVLAGQPLTAGEVAILAAEASGESPAGEAAENSPKLAKNKAELGRILEVSRKTIQRYSAAPDSPAPRPNGSLDVEVWRAYLATKEVIDDVNLDQTALKARQILLQNRLLQQKIDLNDKITVKVEQVEKETADLIATAKAALLTGPSSLAPQVVGVSVQEAEKLLREWLHHALAKLTRNPLGRKTEVANAE